MKDDFEWTHPPIKSADLAASADAYVANYDLSSGFQSSDKRLSTSVFAIPHSVEDNVGSSFETHKVAMDHHLCNLKQSTEWLIKPVGKLLSRMHASKKRPQTRSSLHHAALGQNIFLYSSRIKASKFICATDDISLIDFVENDPTKMIWHCSDLRKSDMLSHTVMSIYKKVTNGDRRYTEKPNWLEWLTTKSLPKSGDENHIQFLGLVSLYENNTGSKVCAFHLHSFVLYRSLSKQIPTRVDLVLTQVELVRSSIQERLLQILQLIQHDVKGSTWLICSDRLLLEPRY